MTSSCISTSARPASRRTVYRAAGATISPVCRTPCSSDGPGMAAKGLQRFQRVRDVAECLADVRADRAHRANRGDRDESRDQAVFNGSRALVVLNQLEKLRHILAPTCSWLAAPVAVRATTRVLRA